MSKKAIFIIIFVVLSVILATVIWYQVALRAHSRNTEAVAFTIRSGESTASILDRLEEQKIIASDFAAKIYLYRHRELKLQAGDYSLEPNLTAFQVLAKLGAGQTVGREVTILFREGLTLKEMQAQLSSQGYLTDGSFEKLGRTKIADLPPRLVLPSFMKLLPRDATLEGYLFPDTYRLYKNFTAEDLAAKMLDNFEKKLTPDMRSQVSQSGKSFHDTIILASILQKEVRTSEEMGLASGVFYNRLEIGQALQSCATLAYILGVNKPQYSYEDTQIDSPYNTYKHAGLPPGPVSNPGLTAISMAIHPTKSDYNYFLSRPDTGETVFSKTLDEHNAAKAKYLK